MYSYKKPSIFINFEGIDNTGKSNLVADIQKELHEVITVYTTSELNTDVGSLILTKLYNKLLDPYEKVLLFAADRQKRYSKDMKDKLKSKCLFLSDRWFFSAIAYRCAEDPSIRGYVREVNKIFILPDFTFYIDISANESIKRGKSLNKNRYLKTYLNKVRKEYLSLIIEYNFIKINGMRKYNLIKDEIINKIKELLKYTQLKIKE